jgi:hypothetical protein
VMIHPENEIIGGGPDAEHIDILHVNTSGSLESPQHRRGNRRSGCAQ